MNTYQWIDYNGAVWGLNNGAVTIAADAEAFKDLETNSFTRDAALLDGQAFSGWRAQPRNVLFPVMIGENVYAGISFADTRREFRAGLRPGKYGTLRVDGDEGVRSLSVRYLREVNPAYEVDPFLMNYEQAAFVMVADDPWWQGPAVSVTMQTAQNVVPFYEPGPTAVLNIMSANTVATPSINNPGEVPAWYTLRVDGPATGFSFGGLGLVAGNVNVALGEWLIVDTNPSQQTALLYSSPTTFVDVTNQLTSYSPYAIPPGDTQNYNATLNGAGSMTVSITPRYFRAY